MRGFFAAAASPIKAGMGGNFEVCERLLCSWCGCDSELFRTKFLTIDRIICRNCMNKQDEELGIEPMEREE